MQYATILLKLITQYCKSPVKRPVTLDYPSRVTISEGAAVYSLSIGMTGVSVDVIPFSLVPLTYQQFETMTGERVENLFDTFPPAASDGETKKRLCSGVRDLILCR